MPNRRRDTLPKSHRRVEGAPPPSGVEKRVSRREREEKQRKQLLTGLAVAGSLIVLVLAGFALNEYWFKPRHVLATVDGHDIRRSDYWKYRAVDLANQANQYVQIANSPFIDDNQRQQYVTLAQQTNAQIDEVWGSTDLNEATLQNMIDDQIYLSSIDEFGITISDQDVQNFINQRFEPIDAPIFTPTPSPTLIPERAEWATQTAVSFEQTAISTVETTDGTPDASPVAGAASPSAEPGVAQPAGDSATPASPATPIAGASPVVSVDASPAGSPAAEATPVLSPTPNQEQAIQTAVAGYEEFEDNILGRAHMSRDDYIRLVVRPQIARERIGEQLTSTVGQRSEQVQAAHILVDTKDLADSLYADLQTGADFTQMAIDNSIDTSTAPNGGDLGWFTRGQMVDEFEQVAFSTPPGQISQPFETEFGWHIVRVIAYEPERAMTDEQITQMRQAAVDDWISGKKSELRISSEIEPTPTAAGPQQFLPPPDAPPLPTEVPEVTPEASPAVIPAASPIAVASPVS